MVSWNCRGYPWRRGPGLGSIAEGKDIIALMETHEHEGCRIPEFEGYNKVSVWNELTKSGKGHGGVTILVRKECEKFIKIEKKDPNNQYIWMKVVDGESTIWIAACYFAPYGSKVYKKRCLNREDPYEALKIDMTKYGATGKIILLGDFNARTSNNQALCFSKEERQNSNPLWLEEEEKQRWKRVSQDSKGGVSFFGANLLGFCCLHDLIICNGINTLPRSGAFTCHTYNGQSVVDYVIGSQSIIPKIIEVEIGGCPLELKSDHSPIYIKLGMENDTQSRTSSQPDKRRDLQHKILLTCENQDIFKNMLEKQLEEIKSIGSPSKNQNFINSS